MDVCAAVIKLWEKECHIRKFYDPVADTILNAVGFCIVAKTCLGKFYRADTAHDMFINLIRCVKHFGTIGGFSWNIIYAMNKDDVVIFWIIVVFNDFIVEGFYKGSICKFALSELHKKVLCATLRLLLKWKLHVHEILSDGSGKGFAEYIKVFEHFFFRKGEKCFF